MLIVYLAIYSNDVLLCYVVTNGDTQVVRKIVIIILFKKLNAS